MTRSSTLRGFNGTVVNRALKVSTLQIDVDYSLLNSCVPQCCVHGGFSACILYSKIWILNSVGIIKPRNKFTFISIPEQRILYQNIVRQILIFHSKICQKFKKKNTKNLLFMDKKVGLKVQTDWTLVYLYLYINLACLSVRLNPINVQTAEPIGPKFFVGSLMNLIKMN